MFCLFPANKYGYDLDFKIICLHRTWMDELQAFAPSFLVSDSAWYSNNLNTPSESRQAVVAAVMGM